MGNLSNSQVEKLAPNGCSQLHWYMYNPAGKAEARRLLGDQPPRPRPVMMVLGTAGHAAIEAWVNHKIGTGGESLPLIDLWEAFQKSWVSEIAKDPNIDWSDPSGKVQAPSKLVSDGRALLGLFREEIAPLIAQPLAAEQKLVSPTPGHPTEPMIGYLDIWGYDAEGRLWVWDLKFTGSSKVWTQEKADKDRQVTSYYHQLRASGQPMPDGFSFAVLIRGAFKNPHKVVVLDTHRTIEQVDNYGLLVQYSAGLKKAGLHVPNPDYLWHSTCPFREVCPHGDPKPVIAVSGEELDL